MSVKIKQLVVCLAVLAVLTMFSALALRAFELHVNAETAGVVNGSWANGDFNHNGIPADAGDLTMMLNAAVGKFIADEKYDLNANGISADAADLAMMKDASVGKIELL